jgi:hypothetical protein
LPTQLIPYEMALRDHFRLDLLVHGPAVLQERDQATSATLMEPLGAAPPS